ncbi:hypothetical protein AXF42_Ash008925 [Apostasia shenzhenica]|uniref:HMA domain-containing protein n=1 Tax=Apostasia shenzhenica TaxID=1088818 RepID=A0A2I0ASW4_9ASPA|nr:hypothetical protein AXF42_Ash008925 [Apostasia shenzhenica]
MNLKKKTVLPFQQKVVLKLSLEDPAKRTKALKVAVALPGVLSAALDGEKLTVVGHMDSVELTKALRKKMKYAELLTVGSAEEKKGEGGKKEDGGKKGGEPNSLQHVVWTPYYHGLAGQPPYYMYHEIRDPSYDEPSCSIM